MLGIYGLVKRALQSTAGAGQQSPMDFVETAIRTRLGMPLPAALGLFTGEFATLQTSRALDPGKQVYVIGIQKKPDVLKLLRTGFGDRMTNERSEGETTFLKISEGGIESSAGTASWKYYHVGVTDDLIVASSRNESVRETLALNKTAVGGSGSAPQSWQAARTKFPARLDGLAFVDFQKIDWSAVKERWNEPPGMNKAKARTIRATSPGPFANTLKNLNPDVFPRHLHMSAGASWKDAQGVHFDGWIE